MPKYPIKPRTSIPSGMYHGVLREAWVGKDRSGAPTAYVTLELGVDEPGQTVVLTVPECPRRKRSGGARAHVRGVRRSVPVRAQSRRVQRAAGR